MILAERLPHLPGIDTGAATPYKVGLKATSGQELGEIVEPDVLPVQLDGLHNLVDRCAISPSMRSPRTLPPGPPHQSGW